MTVADKLSHLLQRLEISPPASATQAAELLAGASLQRKDLEPWIAFDHPAEDSYGRRLVAEGPGFELLVMSWRPGDFSAIHDHGYTQWGAVQHLGASEHFAYDLSDGVLRLAQHDSIRPGTITPVDHDLVHQMGNPNDEPIVSVHMYGAPASPSITGDARVFDLLEQKIQRTDGGVFMCLPETAIGRREPGPRAEPMVVRLHHRLMLARIETIAACGRLTPPLARRRAALHRALATPAEISAP